MMPRRSFLCRAIMGATGLTTVPHVIANVVRPSLWIADSEPAVAIAVQLLARHCGLADARIFENKRVAIGYLRTVFAKPGLVITDYLGGEMKGNEFIRLARHASPETKLILHSAVVGNTESWIAVAGLNAPWPDAIVEKPDARQLMSVLRQLS